MRRSAAVAAAAFGVAAVFAVLRPAPVYTHKPITTNILFKNEIAQIFQRKCFHCHSENNLAMSLTTYTDARPWARAIREEVLDRQMPPWQAVPGYGQFANDLSLNSREKEIIISWADGGAPSGVLKVEESIPPVYVPPAPSWDHAEPDLVLPIGTGHTITSGSPLEVKRFVVATNLATSKRVRAISLKQGDRRVVRHAAFYDSATGRWLGGWTPWQPLSTLAGDTDVLLPARAAIAVEVGYTGTGEDVTDRSELGLYFGEGDGPVAGAISISAPKVSLPPGTTAKRVRVETRLVADTTFLAFWPNPGEGVTSIEIAATTPDGMMTPLLFVNEYRPEWRSPFYLAAPVPLPRGSRVVMTTYFDNPGEQALEARPQAWMATAVSPRAAARRK
ncbi:MAG TPA: hypothetical protein VMO26_02555 [Vicinamibacterales bacterium]|nr:hypothetical protein [Vicinamibacterales bacterium]